MGVMGRIDEILHGNFKSILIWEFSISYIGLNLAEADNEIGGRLLIARRRVSQVCKRTLKLNAFIVILYKTRGDIGIEWYTSKTVKGLLRGKFRILLHISRVTS